MVCLALKVKGGWRMEDGRVFRRCATGEAIPDGVMVEEPASNGLWVLSC